MQFDVVTVGGGFSGLVTACRAAELGRSAAVLEARTEERYPCSSRWSTGVAHVMSLPILSEPDRLYRAILDGSGSNAHPPLVRALTDNARRTIEWLEREGAQFGSEVMQRTRPGARVLAPNRRSVAGLDWEDRGPDLLMRRLEENLTRRGGVLLRGTSVEALVIEGGACVGVDAVRAGERSRITAKAVMIADGGFAANRAMIARYITPRSDRVLCRVGPGAMGDGIRMAEAAGAAIGGLGEFYGHVHHRNAMTNAQLWPYPHLDSASEVGLVVGPDAKRFADEGLGAVCMANAIARLPDPLSAALIIDDAIWKIEPNISTTVPANPIMVESGGELVSAPDVATLAARMGLPAAQLEATVRDYNLAVERGDFARLAVPRTAAKQKPMPIRTPPFHAAPLCAGVTQTMGGVVIDEHAQALKPDGSVLPGLYAAGPVAGLEGGRRAGYVGGVSKAFILGLIAGEHIAAAAG
jgi:fumarate reductase flavoprotein subunit